MVLKKNSQVFLQILKNTSQKKRAVIENEDISKTGEDECLLLEFTPNI